MNPEGKRAAIMQAGEQLFSTRGYAGTSIADIASAAGVAVGTVYRLFPDKATLLAALHERMEDRFVAVMTTAWQATDDYREKFGPLIEALLREAEQTKDTMPLYSMTKDLVGSSDYLPGVKMIESINALYRSGVKAGAFLAIPASVLGPLAHAMVEGGMRAWMMNPTPKHRRVVHAELLAVFERAFLR